MRELIRSTQGTLLRIYHRNRATDAHAEHLPYKRANCIEWLHLLLAVFIMRLDRPNLFLWTASRNARRRGKGGSEPVPLSEKILGGVANGSIFQSLEGQKGILVQE